MREKKEINIYIGEQIRQARETAGLTQEQFSEQIDVSPQYISDLERGVVGISVATLKRACVVLGVSSDRILFGDNWKFRNSAILRRCENLSEQEFTILLEIIGKFVTAMELAKTQCDTDHKTNEDL